MNGSFKLGTAFGIPIYLHWTFLLLAAVLLGLNPVLLVIFPVLCGCVLLHELGHSLAAQHYGIRVHDISLLPIGGMARMSSMPENPRIEGVVAFAGPAVNFALATLGLLVSAAGGLLDAPLVMQLAAQFAWLNILLGGFNLIPAFPMDGGRILRALFALKLDWVRATEGAVRVGRWMALLMGLAPFLLPLLIPGFRGGLTMLPLIALFIWFAGGRELIGVRLRHGLSPIKGVSFAGTGPFGPMSAGDGSSRGGPGGGGSNPGGAAEATPPFEVRDASPVETEASPAPDATAADEAAEARRPAAWSPESVLETPARRPQQGFDPAEIEALERFHGRLRRGAPKHQPGDSDAS